MSESDLKEAVRIYLEQGGKPHIAKILLEVPPEWARPVLLAWTVNAPSWRLLPPCRIAPYREPRTNEPTRTYPSPKRFADEPRCQNCDGWHVMFFHQKRKDGSVLEWVEPCPDCGVDVQAYRQKRRDIIDRRRKMASAIGDTRGGESG